MDQISRSPELMEQLSDVAWDVAVVDEAHRMSAHYSSWAGEVDETKRFTLGRLLSETANNYLLMTATPHAGKEEDFQLFMSLLDRDRFEGKFREGIHRTDTQGLMRRMVKEDLLTFDGKPLFPERRAYTVAFELSPAERDLYEQVTDYVRTEMGRAERIAQAGDRKRGNNVGFIGGTNGQLALDRLQNVIRRVADQWRPSSRDESFEIVRRRLFQAPDAAGLTYISAVARNFANMYRNNSALFPRDAATPNDDYEKRIRASYPLHPELLDRLYEDWSVLERFQRTRGVLKLVSSIVHELWASNDTSPLILPGNVPLDATTVNTDLTQYLEDQWKPIIDSDIDGASSTAQRIDLDRPSLGQRFVTQRIARTIFMGAAPRSRSARKGLDKQYVWLGTAVPGDVLGNFGSAIEQLAQRSTYFYEEQGHYWFDTQPSVTKTASDYAERLREDVETVWNEITRRLRGEERSRAEFDRVHVAPETSADIPGLEGHAAGDRAPQVQRPQAGRPRLGGLPVGA